jgi:uncharacterized protein YjdB
MHSFWFRSRPILLLLVFLGGPVAFLHGCGSAGGGHNPPFPTLVSIALTPKTPSVAAGNSQQFTATGSYSDGSTQNLTSSVTWASSNTATATIKTTGLASALKVGTTTISATFGSVSGSTTLSVTAATLVAIAVTPANPSIVAGQTLQFTTTGTYSDNSTQNLTSTVTWTSSNTTTATITSAGLATALHAGTSTISATSGTVSGSTTLSVTAATLVAIAVTPANPSIVAGQTLQFTTTGTYSDNSTQNLTSTVTWTSSNTTTATITSAGLATALHAGTSTISATSGTVSGSTTLSVTGLAGVFTYHNNLSRDGSNPSEYTLTPSNVTTTSFGKLFSCTVDGAIYAQPLWVANLTINGVKRNVVFVATQHDSLYAFDADINTTPCTPLWHVSLIDAAHGGSSSETSVPSGTSGNLVGQGLGDIMPEVGVTGTPVINPSTNTLYVVSKSVITSGPTFFQRLHAIDLTTGNEKSGSPVTITGTYPATVAGQTVDTFSPQTQNQRPGLALVNGIIYIAWAAHEDHAPYYGWVMGYDATSLAQSAVLNVTPNVGYGGIWMGGGAPSADLSNNLYLITGNATFDANSSTPPNNDYGDSFLKLTSSLSVSQYFTPSDEANDNANDVDFGSGGAAILMDCPSGPVQHLVIGGGKDGYLYLLNRDAMGGLGDANAWQRFNFGNSILSTGAFWNNTFYMAGYRGHLQAFSFNTSTCKFNTTNVSQSSASYVFGGTPSVSSSGTTNGIVWALDNANYCTNQSFGCGPAVLHAYDGTNLATELWNSSQGMGNAAGNAVKFTVPTVANGKVYVGTRGNNTGGTTSSTTIPGELDVYGLLPN